MRIFRVHHALISVLAGSVLAVAGAPLPAQAQFFGLNLFGSAPPPAPRPAMPPPGGHPGGVPPSLTSPGAPLPPEGVPGAAPDIKAGPRPPMMAAAPPPDDDDSDATPVPPDPPVKAASLPAPPNVAASPTAADAALVMANMMDGAGGGVSNADSMAALEDAAAAGQPMALWRLGTMYENGDGVAKDDVKAFGYFSQIANDHADAAPRGVDADIVAQSFVKMGDYYSQGLPDAGIAADKDKAEQLILHAATYFGNADAQYRIGELYLDSTDDPSPLQGARWLSLAAHKGHVAAQAKLGDLLFNGAGIKAQPAEGLMWLSIAHDRSLGTPDEGWINELLTRDMSVATPDEREEAINMADAVEPRFAPRLASEPAE